MKTRRTKRVTALLLAALILGTSLASCGESEANADNTASSGEAAVQTPAAEEAAAEVTESATPHWDTVAKPDLGGMSIIATTNNFDSNFYNVLDWEELTGENLKDAMYNRNRAVESELNCKFSVIYGGGTSVIEQSVAAGSGDVDFAYNLASQGGNLLQKGYLAPFEMLDNIDMTKPYWDQGAQKYLKILDKMYFGFVDFGFDHYDSLAVLFYNGAMIENYQLDDPHELVLENKWTIDAMEKQLAAVLTDKNGDGKYTLEDDIFGLMGREYWFQGFLNASGEYLVTWDKEQKNFSFNMMDENFVLVSEAITKIYNDTNDAVDFSDYDKGRIAFSDGRSLYYSRLLGDFRQLRENEDNYGIVCFPRYAEASDDASYFVKNPTTLFLPTVVCDSNGDGRQDYDEIGSFLEAMGAYTYDITLDVYIENTVIGKGVRDQKSADMVRLMMTNRSFDLCEAFSLHSVMDIYRTCIITGTGLASKEKATRKMFDRLTGNIVEQILEFEG